MSWIKEILQNNAKKVSIIHFVKSGEFSRPIQLLLGCQKKFENYLIYGAWNGLRRVTFESVQNQPAEPKENPVGDDTDVIDPISALRTLIKEMHAKSTLAIIEHFDALSERINGVPDLNDALRSIIREYDWRPANFKKSMLVIFLKDTSHVAKDVLDHTTLYDVAGSTDEERQRLLETAIKERTNAGKWVPPEIDMEGIIMAGAGLTMIQFNTALVLGFAAENVTPASISSNKRLILEASGVGKIITPETALDPEKIGGYDEAKQIVAMIARKIKDRDTATKLGCGNVRGILLFGPPGTGKSLLGEAIGKLANLPIISISAGDIFSKWYGESARAIRKIIEIAEETGAVVFIDEIEAVVGGRGGETGQAGQHEETARTLGELLRWLGDYKRKGIVVGTTNRPDLLDFAMRRAGRFDKILYIPLPDANARAAIFNVHIYNPIDHPKVKITKDVANNLQALVDATELFSGAEIAQVVKDATDFAFESGAKAVSMEHFNAAIEVNRPDMKDRGEMVARYEHWARKFCRGMRKTDVDKMLTGEPLEYENGELEKKTNLGRFA